MPAPELFPGNRFYVTTPIYYVNDVPHIGHAYTTIVADALARYHRLFGREVFFLTGVDEHGQKVQRSADKRGMTPKQHCDDMVARFKPIWEQFNISQDRFIRTTDDDHERNVSLLLQKVHEKGDIYSGEYEGFYHIADETFVTEGDVKPEDLASGDVVKLKEKNYFFKLEQHRDWLINYIKEHPSFIEPESRANWVLAHLREPIADLCISRPKERLSWGIPLPFDTKYVCYVWFDALINYLSGVGSGTEPKDYEPWWPVSCHLIGKDILQHHAIYWPIMLHSMGLPQPRKILAHGWWMAAESESKIGKRQGAQSADASILAAAANAYAAARNDKEARVRAACEVLLASEKRPAGGPKSWLWLADEFGVDQMRYFLLREMTLGQDSRISLELFVKRVNDELANDLGNLVFRAGKMAVANFQGKLPAAPEEKSLGQRDRDLIEAGAKLAREVRADVERYATQAAMLKIAAYIRDANVYFDAREPWKLAKEGKREELAVALRVALDAAAHAAALLSPVTPERSETLLKALGWEGNIAELRFEKLERPGQLLKDGAALNLGDAIFPRIDPVTLAETELKAAGFDPQAPPKKQAATAAPAEEKAPKKGKKEAAPEGVALIGIDDFAKVQLSVAEILSAERVEGADRLLKLQIRLGAEERQLVAGIAKYYAPEALPGKRVIVVANLQPATIRGVESRGMVLAAKKGDKLALVTVDDPQFPSGASVG
jgi:methionyl-tRNA synthetase